MSLIGTSKAIKQMEEQISTSWQNAWNYSTHRLVSHVACVQYMYTNQSKFDWFSNFKVLNTDVWNM